MEAVAAALPAVVLIKEIGSGGFKVVYSAKVNGVDEAVKIVSIPADPNDEDIEDANRRRFFREIELLRLCRTPFLVKLGQLDPLDCQIAGFKYICYSEELLTGESLRNRIEAGQRPSQRELALAGACLLAAVAELVGLQAIHRDIKPDSVLKTSDPVRPFVLLDLGIAFIVGGTNLTLDSQTIPGTRYYLAPEMLDQGFRQSINYRADLYAVGLTLFEYASGHNPFAYRGEGVAETLYRIKHVKPPALVTYRPDIHPSFCALIDQLIKKLPALRPANLAMLIKQMEGYR